MKEIGRKGSVKLCRVPPAGLSSAERTKMYRIATITVRPGYRRMYGESTNLSWKPLYLSNTSLRSVMAREDAARSGWVLPSCLGGANKPVPGRDLLLFVSLRNRQG